MHSNVTEHILFCTGIKTDSDNHLTFKTLFSLHLHNGLREYAYPATTSHFEELCEARKDHLD